MRFDSGQRSAILLVLLVLAGVFGAGCHSTSRDAEVWFELQPGDLLFQDLDAGPLCDAIEKVTTGYRNANFSHVAMVAGDSRTGLFVIEAVSKGVITKPLEAFLERSHDARGQPKVLVGRLTAEYRHLTAAAVEAALALKGKAYDKVFDIENDAYYCSELIYYCFLQANGGTPLFELQPMTFVDPETGASFGAWERYFAELKVVVPEGKPGINPGGISRSPVLRMVHAYGIPSGLDQ